MGFGAFKIFKFGTMGKVFLSLVLTMLAGCGPISPLFAGGPYKGKVIDAETKAPIVGAVVLAVWYRGAPGLGHASHGFFGCGGDPDRQKRRVCDRRASAS